MTGRTWHYTSGSGPYVPNSRTAAAWRFCGGVAATLALLLVVGCGTGRQGRLGDEATLRAEAAANQSPEPFYQLALLHAGRGDTDQAVAALQSALERDADYEPALTLLAKMLHDTGRSFEALEWFARREPHQWPESVRVNLALLHADVGNTIEARRILESVGSGRWAPTAAANLAYLDLLDEEHQSARARLDAVIDQNIDAPEVLNNLAIARLRDGDVDGSAQILQRLTSRHPDFQPAHLNLALLLQHWLFDDEGAARSRQHLDQFLEPTLSDAAIEKLLDPSRVEDAAPPLPPLPPETDGGAESESPPEKQP